MPHWVLGVPAGKGAACICNGSGNHTGGENRVLFQSQDRFTLQAAIGTGNKGNGAGLGLCGTEAGGKGSRRC